MELPIEEYFKYHPPETCHRKECHESINAAALAFAKAVDASVKDPQCKQMAMFAIQQARMFANQGATIDELRILEDIPF